MARANRTLADFSMVVGARVRSAFRGGRESAIRDLRDRAAECDARASQPRRMMDESDWCRAAADYLEEKDG